MEPAIPLTFLAAFPWLERQGVEVEISGLVARPDALSAQSGISPIVVRDAFDPSTTVFPGAVAQLLLFPPTSEFIPYALAVDPFVPSAYVPERNIPRVLAHLGHLSTLRWNPRRVVRAFSNVVAEIRGKRLSDEVIVMGAHLDSFPGTIGASDNAAGCAVLVEVARWFRSHPPDRTVKFAWFTGEELDRRGSKHFVKQLRSGRERICLFINSDGGFEIETGSPWVRVSEERVRGWVRGWLAREDLEIRVSRSEGSDEEAFQEQGIPTFRVCGRSRQSAHLPTDRPDTIDKEKLGLMGQSTLEAAIRAAQASTTWDRSAS